MASAAWIVVEKPKAKFGSAGLMGTAHVVAKGAVVLASCCISSFMAEAIALVEVTEFMLTRHHGVPQAEGGIPITFETATYRTLVRN